MKQNNGPFVKEKSNQALEQDLDMQSPLSEALKRRRKDAAMKRGVNLTDTDSLGNPQVKIDENDND